MPMSGKELWRRPISIEWLNACEPEACASRARVLPGKSPAAAILDVARGENSDLIAIATRGRGVLRRLLFGSVAESIAQQLTGPLLVYCPN